MKLIKASFVGLLAIGATGCGIMDSAKKMMTNMDHMAATTDRLAKKTDEMSDTTKGMAYQTQLLLRLARQGGAQETRREAMKLFISDDMPFEGRAVNAAVYFRSFEFQLFDESVDLKADGTTIDEEYRSALFAAAGEELVFSVRRVAAGPRPDPDPLSNKANMQALFAMGGTMDQMNDLQHNLAERYGFQSRSVMDLLVEALQSKAQADADPLSVPAYVNKILEYEDEARYLFELRYNIYPAVVVDKLYDVSQMGLGDKLKMLLKKKLTVDLAKFNTSEIRMLTDKYIKGALQTRKFMADIGAPIKMNSSLLDILKKAQIKDDPNAAAGKAQATLDLKAGLSELICESGACTDLDFKPINGLREDGSSKKRSKRNRRN